VTDDSGFTLVHRDNFERDGKWLLARRSLGLRAFGLNMVEIAPGDSLTEHDETDRDQEEVFVVISGDAVVIIEDEEHEAPAGTFVRVDPDLRRNVRNAGSSHATVLIASAPRSSGYEPMGWA
jgi:mannose-6-phosphate isomerase-like protein (cupin superfamily)